MRLEHDFNTVEQMKTLDRQNLDVVNKTRSNRLGWREQFTPEFFMLAPS